MDVNSKISQQNNDLGHGPSSVHDRTDVNDGGTNSKSDTPLTRPRSGPVRFVLIDKDGEEVADRNLDGYYLRRLTFASAVSAADHAKRIFPDQSQDPDRTGKGWDVQVCP